MLTILWDLSLIEVFSYQFFNQNLDSQLMFVEGGGGSVTAGADDSGSRSI